VPRSATAIRLWSEKKVGGRADDIDARRPYRRTMPSAFTRTDHHDRDAYLDRLRRARPLATASDGELRAMAQVAEYLRVDAGTPLAGASVHWRGCYLVVTGSLALTTNDEAALVGDGTTLFVTGDESMSLVAVTDVTLIAIARREWRALRALAPGIVYAAETASRFGAPARPGSVVAWRSATSRAAATNAEMKR
jgi:hypothetical protein